MLKELRNRTNEYIHRITCSSMLHTKLSRRKCEKKFNFKNIHHFIKSFDNNINKIIILVTLIKVNNINKYISFHNFKTIIKINKL